MHRSTVFKEKRGQKLSSSILAIEQRLVMLRELPEGRLNLKPVSLNGAERRKWKERKVRKGHLDAMQHPVQGTVRSTSNSIFASSSFFSFNYFYAPPSCFDPLFFLTRTRRPSRPWTGNTGDTCRTSKAEEKEEKTHSATPSKERRPAERSSILAIERDLARSGSYSEAVSTMNGVTTEAQQIEEGNIGKTQQARC